MRKHNLLALRGIKAFQCMIDCGGVAVFEQPALRQGEVSMLRLDEFAHLLSNARVQHHIKAQCPFGSSAEKLTSWVTFNVCFEDMSSRCQHQPTTWYLEGTGETMSAKHPPSHGSSRYFKTKSEACEARKSSPSDYVTARLAAYPPLLNKYLALKVKLAATKVELLPMIPAPPVHAWDERLQKEHVEFSQTLRGTVDTSAKEAAELLAVGGMRNANASLKRLSHVAAFGRPMGLAIEKALTQNSLQCCRDGQPEKSWVNTVCDMIGKDDQRTAPEDAVAAVRRIIEQHCGYSPPRLPRPDDCTTNINASLLEAWRAKANDPDSEVAKWLYSGAPAGITIHPPSCGIFPEIGDSPDEPHEDVATDFCAFRNYAGVDDDTVAEEEIKHHIRKGHLKSFATIDELQTFLKGQAPILNKIGIVTKGIKKRMILDTAASRVKQCSAKNQRVLLPRLLDAILQGLQLFDKCSPGEGMEWFVLDFVEAFWQVPLDPAERRFFCAMLDIDGLTRYLVYLRTVQGYQHSPI